MGIIIALIATPSHHGVVMKVVSYKGAWHLLSAVCVSVCCVFLVVVAVERSEVLGDGGFDTEGT